MAKINFSFDEYIAFEQNIVNDLLLFFNNETDFSRIIYTNWTAKDVLSHIVMWHESFANNIMAIIEGTNPKLLTGSLYEINETGVKESKEYSVDELCKKLIKAQEIIINNIKNEKIETIPYRKNTKRKYTKEEHIEIVYKHIKSHYEDMIKKYK